MPNHRVPCFVAARGCFKGSLASHRCNGNFGEGCGVDANRRVTRDDAAQARAAASPSPLADPAGPRRPLASGYLAHRYRKDPHVPPVTSTRILAETTGVYPLGQMQSPVRALATAH